MTIKEIKGLELMLKAEKTMSCPPSADGVPPIICVQDLAVTFQSNVAIFDVNLDIYPGDYVGILGPNGSGKTTLLKAVLGIFKPIRGTISVFNQKISQGNRNQTLSKIGYVPQVHNIDKNFPALVKDVVMMGRYSQTGLFRRVSSKDEEIVQQCLKTVEMEEFAQRPIGHLSGGQQQKVLIARSLAQNPEILLLDEPTSALDFKIARSIMGLISRLHREKNLTVVLVSHDIKALRESVSRVICIDKTIVWAGDPENPKLDNVISRIFYGR
ncbi:MAG: metal ABC transporter ATP-binding protein [Candidatus Hodarchaeota archaeon]